MLRPKSLANDPTDPLKRTYSGWDPTDDLETNWANNHGYYALNKHRAESEEFVLFSFRREQRIVMAGRIDAVVDAAGKPGKCIVEGGLLDQNHKVWRAYVGQPTPEECLVRSPVRYLDLRVPDLVGRPSRRE